jgi:hypothetical protein
MDRSACSKILPGQPCAVRERSLELHVLLPLSCTAGEGDERSEAGEGLTAVSQKKMLTFLARSTF